MNGLKLNLKEGPKRTSGRGFTASVTREQRSGSAQGENAQKSERKRRRRTQRKNQLNHAHRGPGKPVEAIIDDKPINLNEEQLERRRGRERKVAQSADTRCWCTFMREYHIAVLEGRSLIEHYVSHPADDVSEIHGKLFKVQKLLPGMEAAFVDIGTPKMLYCVEALTTAKM